MRTACIIAFVAGIVCVQQWPTLPPLSGCLLAVPVLFLYYRLPRYRWVCVAVLGIIWAVLSAHWRVAAAWPEELAGKNVTLKGYIASIPDLHERGLRFEFAVDEYLLAGDYPADKLPARIRLSWYGSAGGDDAARILLPGEYWQLTVRLKPPHGFINPGGFDYEAWLFGQNIRATGYVRDDAENRRLRDAGWRFALQGLRYQMLSRIRALVDSKEYAGLIAALAIGYQSDIDKAQWQLLVDTGTIHLISISGLHISLIAGLCYWLALNLHLLCIPLFASRLSLWPAQKTAALAGLCGGAVYSAMAGFSLPTVRSLIMLSVVFCALFFYRQLRPWQSLLTALLLVTLIDPFAVNSVSFWLSFGAVAVLVYLLSGRFSGIQTNSMHWRLYRWGVVQLAMLAALIPLTLFWFGRAVLTAGVANFIAIPWVSFTVVPLILLATAATFVSDTVAAILFKGAVLLLQWLWWLLQGLANLPYGQWVQHPPHFWILLLALAGMSWLLAPRGVPARWLGLACLLPLFWHNPEAPSADGDVWLSVLDVGQGTAVVVRTRNHALLYDAGPRFSENFDAGSAVVVPYLRAQGLRRLDRLIVSHADNDHQGGVESVLQQIPVDLVMAGEPDKYPVELPRPLPCIAGQYWQWDGVRFEILAPLPHSAARRNNASCVLSIVAPGGSILLPGDIEKEVEQALWLTGKLRAVDILVLPHHGSRSSSTPQFVAALQPRYAVATADYRNRYGFPKPDILRRYREAGAEVLVTGYTGAVHFTVDHAQGVAEPVLYRNAGKRYWHHAPILEEKGAL